ncbi:MAG: chromate resistance protein ChrB domain-containing protein [Syntrophomonadaceae bacterium]
MKWLFLVHELQGLKSRDRVRIWRNTKKAGAILFRDSAYVLPYSKESLESFQWILSEIKGAKGQGSIFISQSTGGKEDDELKNIFIKTADAEYGRLLERRDNLLMRFEHLQKSSHLSEKILRGLKKELAQLTDQFEETFATDYFNSPMAQKVKQELAILNINLTSKIPTDSAAKPLIKYYTKDFQRKKWATRKNIHIDRLCSAWLIKRFIDINASFEFAPENLLPKDAIYFDVFGCQFGHRGEDCTFETLLKSFQIKDKVLCNISEIVHDIDLKDMKFNRSETKGIDSIVRSLSGFLHDDHKVCEIGFLLLDGFYHHIKTARNKHVNVESVW